MINFDTSLYEPPVRAAVVDAFTKRVSDDAGGFVNVGLAESALPHWAEAGNRRHQCGEHSPLVVGHTIDGAPETQQPPKVGWLTGPFEMGVKADGSPAIFGQHWFRKETTLNLNGALVKLSARELVDLFPGRSAELWFRDKKIHPVAMLGATTPERELGVIRLDATSGPIVTRSLPPIRLSKEPEPMAEAKKDEGKLPDTDHASFKQFEAMLAQQGQQIQALGELVGQLQAQVSAAGHGGQGGPSDDQLEALLNQHLGGGEGEPQEEPAPKKAKLSRTADAPVDEEKEALKVKLSRIETEQKLAAVEAQGVQFGFANPEERAAFTADLQALPPAMQDRIIDRVKLSRVTPVPSPDLLAATANAAQIAAGKKQVTKDDEPRLIKLARERNISFTDAARAEGYETAIK